MQWLNVIICDQKQYFITYNQSIQSYLNNSFYTIITQMLYNYNNDKNHCIDCPSPKKPVLGMAWNLNSWGISLSISLSISPYRDFPKKSRIISTGQVSKYELTSSFRGWMNPWDRSIIKCNCVDIDVLSRNRQFFNSVNTIIRISEIKLIKSGIFNI